MRKLFFGVMFTTASLFGLAAHAEQPAAAPSFEAGKHYVELRNPVPTATADKVEVVELFWYGCGHCYQFEAHLKPWSEQLPEDVALRKLPALFGGLWNAHGQLYLTLEAMGAEPKVHEAIFEAIHKQNRKLATPGEMADFLAEQGMNRNQFLQTYNSFGVKSAMEKAKRQAMAYQVSGVPVMVVAGKYRFDLGSAGGPQRALELAEFLIEKERRAR